MKIGRLTALGVGLLASTRLVSAQPDEQPPPPTPPLPPPQTTPCPPPAKAPPCPEPPPQPLPPAPPPPQPKAWKLEVYGFNQLDAGFDFGHIGNPNWQDTMRPTKLPSFANQFGDGPRTYFGVRQTRFGTKATVPTDHGDFKAQFEWELFGVNVDEGQTTFRLRHAYGDWGQFRAGQTWSPFMDIDIFPNSLEYWGPNGMPFFRNAQIAWMPIQGDSRVTIALERPGASPDSGVYAGRVELEDVVTRFPAPDLSAEGRYGGKWGYVELSGILRWIEWDDVGMQPGEISGSVLAWGVHLSSNIIAGPVTFRLSAVYGAGIQNYMNDAGDDVGPVPTNDPNAPLDGKALPVFGGVAFADIKWNKLLTSAIGYSAVWVDNSAGQAPDAFHIGQYALGNLLVHPSDKLMLGAELQWGRRENNSDGFRVNDWKIQVGARFSYSKLFEWH